MLLSVVCAHESFLLVNCRQEESGCIHAGCHMDMDIAAKNILMHDATAVGI